MSKRSILPAYAQAALKEADKLEPLPRFHAPPLVEVERVEPIRFAHPAYVRPVTEWSPSEQAVA